MNTLKRVGMSIRQARKQAGYTLDDLADKAGLSSGKYLGKIERGEVNATLKTLEHIASTLGIEVEDFFQKAEDELVLELLHLVQGKKRQDKERIVRVVKALEK